MLEISTEVPDRAEDQDEVVLVVVCRRTDPSNPAGGASGDIPASMTSAPSTELVNAINDYLVANNFDPDQSYTTIPSSVDVEAGGAITVSNLLALMSGS